MKRIFVAAMLMAMLQTAFAVTEEPIVLNTGSGELNGSLLLPTGEANLRAPVVLLVAGSGPTDRDGNSKLIRGRNDSLKMLAVALAEAGFASVRFDKRGLAGSASALSRESDLRFETYAQDAAAWVRKLADDRRFTGVAILGHSEGSLLGMLAAQASPAKAYVSVAGFAEGAPALLRQQLKGKLPPDLSERNEAILSSLEKGETVTAIPPSLNGLYRPNIQPYLISWFKYLPTAEIRKLQVPCLVLQGDTDIQVPVSQAAALQAANTGCKLQVIRGMNHVLKLVPPDQAQQLASYGDPALPISPALVEELTRFLSAAMNGSTKLTAEPSAMSGR
jgi:pimeloyl-ACP methyl ester carboxylesterase